jgi:hypothetical protein
MCGLDIQPSQHAKMADFSWFFAIRLDLPTFSATVFLKKPVFLMVSHVERAGLDIQVISPATSSCARQPFHIEINCQTGGPGSLALEVE